MASDSQATEGPVSDPSTAHIPSAPLCSIGNAGRHLWSFRGGVDLFVYEQGLAVIRVTVRESFDLAGIDEAREKGREWVSEARKGNQPPPLRLDPLAQAMANRLDKKSSPDQRTLVLQHPDGCFLASEDITDAVLRKGMVVSSLTLTLDEGETRRWVWLKQANPDFEHVALALGKTLGSVLVIR